MNPMSKHSCKYHPYQKNLPPKKIANRNRNHQPQNPPQEPDAKYTALVLRVMQHIDVAPRKN